MEKILKLKKPKDSDWWALQCLFEIKKKLPQINFIQVHIENIDFFHFCSFVQVGGKTASGKMRKKCKNTTCNIFSSYLRNKFFSKFYSGLPDNALFWFQRSWNTNSLWPAKIHLNDGPILKKKTCSRSPGWDFCRFVFSSQTFCSKSVSETK